MLSLDVTELMHERSTNAVGAALGLPSAPGQALALAAEGRRGLLVIDALDSVGANRDKPVELFPILDRVIRHAHAHPHLTIVISCRSEDLEADERLRALFHRDASADVVEVPPLADNEVTGVLARAGMDPDELDRSQFELVRMPVLLRLLIDSRDAGPCTFQTEEQLRERYLDHVVGRDAE